MSHYSENVMSWSRDARKRGDVVSASDLECASAHIAKLSREIERQKEWNMADGNGKMLQRVAALTEQIAKDASRMAYVRDSIERPMTGNEVAMLRDYINNAIAEAAESIA